MSVIQAHVRPGLVSAPSLLQSGGDHLIPRLLECAQVITGYGSGWYPVKSIQGVPNRGGTHANRAEAMMPPSHPSQYDQLLIGERDCHAAFKLRELTGVQNLMGHKRTSFQSNIQLSNLCHKIKLGYVGIERFHNDLVHWDGPLHGRFQKPVMLMVKEEDMQAAIKSKAERDMVSNDEEAAISCKYHWLETLLNDIDSCRFNALKVSLMQTNDNYGGFLCKGDPREASLGRVDLIKLLQSVAVQSYDGDIRTSDATSCESIVRGRMERHLEQNKISWYADYLPLLLNYSPFLGLGVSCVGQDASTIETGCDVSAIRALVEASRMIADSRFSMGMECVKEGGEVPNERDLLANSLGVSTSAITTKEVYEAVSYFERAVIVRRNQDVWYQSERDGLGNIDYLYNSLPKSFLERANRISSRRRLGKLYGPKNFQDILGGPLPYSPLIVTKALQNLNRKHSMRLAADSLFSTGWVF